MGKASGRKKAEREARQAAERNDKPIIAAKAKSGAAVSKKAKSKAAAGGMRAGKAKSADENLISRYGAAATIFLLTLALRLIKIGSLFSFHDEADYVRWAQLMKGDFGQYWNFPLKFAGIMPLNVWLQAFGQNFFSDPLIANRAVCSVEGAFSAVGLYLIGRRLFSERVGRLAGLLYAVNTYFFFWNRTAHYDTLLSTFGIWCIYFAVRYRLDKQLKDALLCGAFLGLGMLTKQIGYTFLAFPFLASLFLADKPLETIKEKRFWLTFAAAGAVFLPLFIGFYSDITRLGTEFLMTPASYLKFTGKVLTFSELLLNWSANLTNLWLRLSALYTLPMTLMAVIALIWGVLKAKRDWLFLLFCGYIPLAFLVLVGSQTSPQYYISFLAPLTVAVAAALDGLYRLAEPRLPNRQVAMGLGALALCLFLLPALTTDFRLWTNPYSTYPRLAYANGAWIAGGPSGQHWRNFLNFAEPEAATGKKLLIAGYIFDQNVQLLPTYLEKYPNVVTNGMDWYRSGYLDGADPQGQDFKKDYPEAKKTGYEVWLLTMEPDDPRPMQSFEARFGKLKPFKVFKGWANESGQVPKIRLYKL